MELMAMLTLSKNKINFILISMLCSMPLFSDTNQNSSGNCSPNISDINGNINIDCSTKVLTAPQNNRKNSNKEQVFKTLVEKAKAGHAESQNLLGARYINGEGVEKDEKQAEKWFLKAARNGSISAKFNLGSFYSIKGNFKKEVEWYKKAAESGHNEAQYNLGIINMQLGKDKEALKWFHRAAENSHVGAQYNLGSIYGLNGGGRPAYFTGVKPNITKSLKWYRKAAKQGHPEAQLNLGAILISLRRNKYEQDEGADWLSKAYDNKRASRIVKISAEQALQLYIKKKIERSN